MRWPRQGDSTCDDPFDLAIANPNSDMPLRFWDKASGETVHGIDLAT
jgi:hypothetical protein